MSKLADGLALVGMALFVAGIYLLFGVGMALMVGGLCLIITGVVMAISKAARRAETDDAQAARARK